MSTHPNAILLLTLTPDSTSRKTYRAIMSEAGVTEDDGDLKIGFESYHTKVMESDYDDGYQIPAKEGDIIIFNMVTYGYGELIEWDKLVEQKAALQTWADGVCERHQCKAAFYITANYW